ncbi:MAG: alpha-glucuronidase [Actinomycetales bacterium]|nr:alpha-glucuronidase [Actinomycetales bacterium]
MVSPHPAWLPQSAFAHLSGRRTVVVSDGGLVGGTVRFELERAGARATASDDVELVLAEVSALRAKSQLPAVVGSLLLAADGGASLGPEGFLLARAGGVTAVLAGGPSGLLYGFHELVRRGAAAFDGELAPERHAPQQSVRMLNHWDNLHVHDVMGQVERGYAGGSIFWVDGAPNPDRERLRAYARLLGSVGINAVSVNNVNVGSAAVLLTERLADVVDLAEIFRPHGIRVFLSVSFASPMLLGGLDTADPLDPGVADWWAGAAADVYAAIPDFGGFVVKADSEGQPGPFAYGRDHADGANVLARALAPHGGTVFWRAFVYNHHQDWRDRSTDRARAAFDHFTPLDGRFDENVVVQVKHGPLDFQVREAVSPVLAAMPHTRLAVELQVTQEYTGHQKHVYYLGEQWAELLAFRPWGESETDLAGIAAGQAPGGRRGGIAAVSNVGTDEFWTGHPLAQANLYAYGRLAWDAGHDPLAILDEWAGLSFGADGALRAGLREVMAGSWLTYEKYTAPLGVCFMVTPGSHYGPSVDGYEYSPWGTYHFADRDGLGVDRTVATGTGYAGQYPEPWRSTYESLDTCPDELLLFFHHVPYTHVLRSGTTVIQHIYDTHFAGVEEAEARAAAFERVAGSLPADVVARVRELLAEQLRSTREWRDQVNTYFSRKSGIPDAHARPIHP